MRNAFHAKDIIAKAFIIFFFG